MEVNTGNGNADGMELLYLIDPRFQQIDFEDPMIQKTVIFVAFMFFFVVYILSMILTPLMLGRYRQLRTKEKVFWHLAIVRSVFGVFGGTVGLWALFTPTAMDRDVIFGKTPTSSFAITVTVGFFAFECSALLISDIVFKSANVLLNLHHWLSLVGYYLVLQTGANHLFACKGLTLEMSTPFSALCWTMLKCGKEKSWIWKANQFLLVHTFHCRSIVECYFWYVSYVHWDYIYTQMPTSVFYALYIQLPLVTFVMTPYWTYKKTIQMIEQKDWNFEDSAKDKSYNGSIKKST